MSKNKFKEVIFNLAPSAIKARLLRKSLNLSHVAQEGLIIKLAETKEELEAAFGLTYKAYHSLGLTEANPDQIRVSNAQVLPTSAITIAVWHGRVVGTITHVLDTQAGLPLDKMWDVNFLRQQGKRLAEISNFAIEPTFRGKHNFLFLLLRYLVDFSINHANVDAWVIATHPRVRDFYKYLFGFEDISKTVKQCSHVKNAKAYGQYLDIRKLEENLKMIYGTKSDEQNLHKFFFETTFTQSLQFPEFRYYKAWHKVFDSEIVRDLFKDRAQIVDGLSAKEKSVFVNFYPGLSKLIVDPINSESNRLARLENRRFHVNCPVYKIGFKELRLKEVCIYNVSKSGFMILSASVLEENCDYEFCLKISPTETIHLRAKLKWQNLKSGYCGFEIIGNLNHSWRLYINWLDQSTRLIKQSESAQLAI